MNDETLAKAAAALKLDQDLVRTADCDEATLAKIFSLKSWGRMVETRTMLGGAGALVLAWGAALHPATKPAETPLFLLSGAALMGAPLVIGAMRQEREKAMIALIEKKARDNLLAAFKTSPQ